MEISARSTIKSRKLLRAVIAILVVVALGAGAVLFAPGLRASTVSSPAVYTTGSVPYVNSASPLFRPAAVPALSVDSRPTGYRDAGASPIRLRSTIGWTDAGASVPLVAPGTSVWRDAGAGAH